MVIQTTSAGLMCSSWAIVGRATLDMLASRTEAMMAINKTAAAGIMRARGRPSGTSPGSLADACLAVSVGLSDWVWVSGCAIESEWAAPALPFDRCDTSSLSAAVKGADDGSGLSSGALDIIGSIDSAHGPDADEDVVSVFCG